MYLSCSTPSVTPTPQCFNASTRQHVFHPQPTITMPPQRAPPAATPRDTCRRHNLTPDQRQQIISRHKAGSTTTELAAEMQCHASTIRRTLVKFSSRSTMHDAPRSGRPAVITPRAARQIVRAARTTSQNKIGYKNLSEVARPVLEDGTLGKAPGHATIYRMLKKQGIIKPRHRAVPGARK